MYGRGGGEGEENLPSQKEIVYEKRVSREPSLCEVFPWTPSFYIWSPLDRISINISYLSGYRRNQRWKNNPGESRPVGSSVHCRLLSEEVPGI